MPAITPARPRPKTQSRTASAGPKGKGATKPPSRQSKLNFTPAANIDAAGGHGGKAKTSGNGSILSFFKKVHGEEELFIGGCDESETLAKSGVKRSGQDVDGDGDSLFGDVKGDQEDIYDLEPTYGRNNDRETSPRFNEDAGSVKRRKLSHEPEGEGNDLSSANTVKEEPTSHSHHPPTILASPKKAQKKRTKGPFLDISDSENEDDETGAHSDRKPSVKEPQSSTKHEAFTNFDFAQFDRLLNYNGPPSNHPQSSSNSAVKVEPCSITGIPGSKEEEPADDEFKDLDGIESGFYADDGAEDSEDGEERRMMRYMQEQARLEAEVTGEDYWSDDLEEPSRDETMTERCPLCEASLAGVTPEQASIHVNGCLDGKPVPLPSQFKPPQSRPPNQKEPVHKDGNKDGSSSTSKFFSRAAVPRPGQANPISIGGLEAKTTSAFSKLMSNHAEDSAWAEAAATETASRGKPAYKRTCPFYKIMPGFSICVDAFRYGVVQGCNAYFLSHFHSDHYIGLSASWLHGPIYCSKVTGSLVKSKLKTNSQWVRELEFEETVEIPGTGGARVTMIPANHCPGSSLFLFEKPVGSAASSDGNTSSPKMQRILHCGDFRACVAHVTHPLLKPDVQDVVTRKMRQQKIDNDVIRSCAEFCRDMSGNPDADDDSYSAMKSRVGNSSRKPFFGKGSNTGNKNKKGNSKLRNSNIETHLNGTSPKEHEPRLLVICGTYSIGKERICKAIAKALQTKIFACASKARILRQLEDPELEALLTDNPREAQVHMQMLMEIRAETLQDYLNGYKPYFSRIVGFRPSGWSFRNADGGGGDGAGAKKVGANVSPSTIPTTQILHGNGSAGGGVGSWHVRFSVHDLVPQRGSTREAMCFSVPYSEHSSFRELALFVMALRIEKIVPTVNVGNEGSRKRMKSWLDRWMAERRRGGIVKVLTQGEGENGDDEEGKGMDMELWDGKGGKACWVHW